MEEFAELSREKDDEIARLVKHLSETKRKLSECVWAMESARWHNITNCIARGEDPKDDDVNKTLRGALIKIGAISENEPDRPKTELESLETLVNNTFK